MYLYKCYMEQIHLKDLEKRLFVNNLTFCRRPKSKVLLSLDSGMLAKSTISSNIKNFRKVQ